MTASKSLFLLIFVSLSTDLLGKKVAQQSLKGLENAQAYASSKRCNGGDHCCKWNNKCFEGDGDCDHDSDCQAGLKCGTNNCINMAVHFGKKHNTFDSDNTDDCCYVEGKDYLTPLTCNGHDSCCTDERKCAEGEGDCDHDSNCKNGLKCGKDNCIRMANFFGRDASTFDADNTDDCCEVPNKSYMRCNGADDCCKDTNKCFEGEGDCDYDSNCHSGLKCGKDNCREMAKWLGEDPSTFHADNSDDCCYDPKTSEINGNRICTGIDDCCTDSSQCSEGEGDCDYDSNCTNGLKCGKDNCKKIAHFLGKDESTFEQSDDCCELPHKLYNPHFHCDGGDSCCTGHCGEAEGDCDHDWHCEGNLKCGTNNCIKMAQFYGKSVSTFHSDNSDDCCYDPNKNYGFSHESPMISDVMAFGLFATVGAFGIFGIHHLRKHQSQDYEQLTEFDLEHV